MSHQTRKEFRFILFRPLQYAESCLVDGRPVFPEVVQSLFLSTDPCTRTEITPELVDDLPRVLFVRDFLVGNNTADSEKGEDDDSDEPQLCASHRYGSIRE